MLVDKPNLSIVAIDPGGTCGVAIYDSWDDRVYYTHVDAGRGIKPKIKVHGGRIESPERRVVLEHQYGGSGYMARRGHGQQGEYNVLLELEDVACTVMLDLIGAVGPIGVVIMEDFILGWGDASKAGSSGREGLSPVRIGVRMQEKLHFGGYFNGDAWRDWDGFGATGEDGRGVHVRWQHGAVPSLKDRYVDIQKWRLGLPRAAHSGMNGVVGGALWSGKGVRMLWKLPGTRMFIGGDEKKTGLWLRSVGLWKLGYPHAMDAMMHLCAFARKAGFKLPESLEPIHATSISTGKERVKAVRR